MKKYDQSYEQLTTAVAKGRKYNDAHRFCESLVALGDYYLETGKHQEAIQPYDEALTITNQYSFQRLKERILLNLSECWKNIGNNEKYISLLVELQSELRLREQEVAQA
jgi:tetratricopeptide (TPR) repeat protein